MAAGAAISSTLSLGEKLLPVFSELAEDLSCSSSQMNKAAEIREDLVKLMGILEQIRAIMHDADDRAFGSKAVQLWLEGLGSVAYEAEDVLDGYHYEVLRQQAETGGATTANSCKRKRTQLLDLDCDQIKHIISKLEEVCQCRSAIKLRSEHNKDGQLQICQTRQIMVEQKIFGREKEKEELINVLLSGCQSGGFVAVVVVLGVGGIGKTSLVQLVYDDERVRQNFDEFGWVCVSGDFSVGRITREVLKSVTNQHYDLNNLNALQDRFRKVIRGKRLLLVLDDMWNDDMFLWNLFCSPFLSAKLVKIVITTRNGYIPVITRAELTLRLVGLPEDECWQLFQHYAFGGINPDVEPEYVDIGKQIIKRCDMWPMGIKLIACLLRHEPEERSWREILESNLWNSGESMIPALMICYSRLPAYLKPCFLYCSMFPKDYEHSVEDLCQLWVAQCYTKSTKGKSLETAQGYIKQLWQRALFDCQLKGSDFKNSKVKLQDLIHELAMFISGTGFLISSESAIHLYVMNNMKLVQPLLSHSLRTLTVGNNVENFLTASDVSKLQSLRVLELKSQCCDSEFLSSIGNFKHLRYLSLGSFSFQRLPESIGLLYNLQNLALTECTNLEELPDGIRHLVNLQVLRLSCCLRFRRLPECIGNFRNLEKLVLHKCDIRELPAGICQLYALQELLITGCRNLKDLPEDIGRLSALEILVIEATGVRYLPHSLNNVKGLKGLILTFKKREQ